MNSFNEGRDGYHVPFFFLTYFGNDTFFVSNCRFFISKYKKKMSNTFKRYGLEKIFLRLSISLPRTSKLRQIVFIVGVNVQCYH
jgi:hypothetical protein